MINWLRFPYEPRKKLSEILLPLLETRGIDHNLLLDTNTLAKTDHLHHFAAFVLGYEVEFESLVGVLPHNSIKLKDTHHQSNLKLKKSTAAGVRKRTLSFGLGKKEKNHHNNHEKDKYVMISLSDWLVS